MNIEEKEEKEDDKVSSSKYVKKPFVGFPYKGVDVPSVDIPIDMVLEDSIKEPIDLASFMDSFVRQVDEKIDVRIQENIDKVTEIEKNIKESIHEQTNTIKDQVDSLYFSIKNQREGENFDKLIIKVAFIALWVTIFAFYVAPTVNTGIDRSVAIIQGTANTLNSGIKILNNIGKFAGFKIPEITASIPVEKEKGVKEGVKEDKNSNTPGKTNKSNNSNTSNTSNTSSKTNNLPHYGFIRPLPSKYRIGSRFNPRRKNPVDGVVRPHNGSDLGAPSGTPIKAPQDGKVYLAKYKGACGNAVGINHGSINGKNMKTIYCHLSSILVTPGQEVFQGTTIGLVGSTGRSTGPHLHYGLMINGRWVDPQKYIID
jgi:murein DD-endopeptidase MepM/ murein hydrolase activator NlpD